MTSGPTSAGFPAEVLFYMNLKFAAAVALLLSSAPVLYCQDAKSGAENLKYSRETYSKIHMVAIAKLEFEAPPAAEFKYDRYPNGGAERIQSGDGEEYARKDGKTWLKSNDWGETGEPVDAQTAKRLNNWIGVIDSRLNSTAPLKLVSSNAGKANEVVFEEETKGKGQAPRFVFEKHDNEHPPLLREFSGPMKLGTHDAKIDIKFSYLIAVQIQDVNEHPTAGASASPSSPTPTSAAKTALETKSQSKNSDPDADLVNRGIEKGKKGDLSGAIADFDRAIKLDPRDALAYQNRAYAKRLKKDPAGAIADYTRAIELDPNSADAYYNRGNVKTDRNDLDGAIADYDRTIELDPKYSHAFHNRAVAKKKNGDANGAEADFKRAGEIDPELAPPAMSTITLLDGKLKIDVPSDFKREPDDPKEPKTLAKFAHNAEGGAWGTVLRGTHGLKPEELNDYMKKRVAEYSKGFRLPKGAHLQWLHKEVVTINGWKWADWSFVPMLKGKKDWRNNPVYTRNLTTSYKGQLLEINFTTNLTTDPELKDEIDKIIASVRIEE